MGRIKSRGRISNRIRNLRFETGELTQQELAELIGVSRQTVVAIEGDKYAPSLEVAFRIATVFGVSLDSVFQYAGGPEQVSVVPADERPFRSEDAGRTAPRNPPEKPRDKALVAAETDVKMPYS